MFCCLRYNHIDLTSHLWVSLVGVRILCHRTLPSWRLLRKEPDYSDTVARILLEECSQLWFGPRTVRVGLELIFKCPDFFDLIPLFRILRQHLFWGLISQFLSRYLRWEVIHWLVLMIYKFLCLGAWSRCSCCRWGLGLGCGWKCGVDLRRCELMVRWRQSLNYRG